MKQILKLSWAIVLLFCTTLAQTQDSTLYKIKLIKFEKQVKNSKIATYCGLGVVLIGSGVAISSYIVHPDDFDHEQAVAGYIVAGAGVIASVISGIHWSVGKSKVTEYKIRLDDTRSGFYFNSKSAGVTLTFRF
jgi:H+/Cl- antiporter ClcA